MKTRTGYFVKRNGIYYVAWKMNGKSFMKSTGTRNKREAEKKRVEIMTPFIVGDEIEALKAVSARIQDKESELTEIQNEKNPPLLLSESWQEYSQSSNRPDSGPRTLKGYVSHFSQFFGWMKKQHIRLQALRDVDKDIAREYARSLMKRGISSNTFNKHIRFLELFFRVLREKAKLSDNPWEGIQRKRLSTQSRRELTIEELRKVCQSAQGELQILLALGVYTGLRLGDCATLRWGEVDLHRKIIRRIPNKTARGQAKPVLPPIHPILYQFLKNIPKQDQPTYVLPETAAMYNQRSDLVTDLVQQHFETCGIKTQKPGTGKGTDKRAVVEVGFHSLRHTFVSLCRESNAPLAVVESIVGHSNPAMTRHYTHTSEEAAVNAVGLLPDITGETKKTRISAKVECEKCKEVCALVESMNAKNWRRIKKELLAHLS